MKIPNSLTQFECRAMNWELVCRTHDLSEKQMEEYENHINWQAVSYYQSMSEEFIRQYADRVDWKGVLNNPLINLSEEFIMEMQMRGFLS